MGQEGPPNIDQFSEEFDNAYKSQPTTPEIRRATVERDGRVYQVGVNILPPLSYTGFEYSDKSLRRVLEAHVIVQFRMLMLLGLKEEL